MPDIENRSKREEALQTLLRRALGRTRTRIIDALGDPPSLSNVPDALWEEMRADVEDDTRRAIAIVFLLAMRRMSGGHQFRPEADLAGERAGRYAEDQARRLARGMVDTFRDRLRPMVVEAKRRLADGESQARIEADLRRYAREIAEQQAESGGVTETTAANSAGEMEYKRLFEDENGIELLATWRTERDDKVCPICQPLDGQPEAEWVEDFPDGPPGHPNCRCWLEFEPAEVEV